MMMYPPVPYSTHFILGNSVDKIVGYDNFPPLVTQPGAKILLKLMHLMKLGKRPNNIIIYH